MLRICRGEEKKGEEIHYFYLTLPPREKGKKSSRGRTSVSLLGFNKKKGGRAISLCKRSAEKKKEKKSRAQEKRADISVKEIKKNGGRALKYCPGLGEKRKREEGTRRGERRTTNTIFSSPWKKKRRRTSYCQTETGKKKKGVSVKRKKKRGKEGRKAEMHSLECQFLLGGEKKGSRLSIHVFCALKKEKEKDEREGLHNARLNSRGERRESLESGTKKKERRKRRKRGWCLFRGKKKRKRGEKLAKTCPAMWKEKGDGSTLRGRGKKYTLYRSQGGDMLVLSGGRREKGK